MGRRIPKSRKNKKLKSVDPCYTGKPIQQKNRKPRENEPPKNEDYQEIPFSAKKLLVTKNYSRKSKVKRKKKNKLKDDFIIVKKDKIEDGQYGMTRPLKYMPEKLVQKANQSEEQFLYKIQQMANNAISEAKMEKKYGVDFIHVDDKSVSIHQSTNEKSMKKQKRAKYQQKLKEKKKRKIEDDVNFESFKDEVKFGEVVLEPPTLSTKPKKSQDRCGIKHLHLSNFLKDQYNLMDLPQERKNITFENKKILENERIRVVDLYRTLKKKK